jgi:excisionase family DNA binding protein
MPQDVKSPYRDVAERVTSTPMPPAADAGADFPSVLTTADAAELLQVHVEYLRKLVRDGKVPCHRFPGGREMRFHRDELLEWLRSLPGHDQSTSTKRGAEGR